MSYSSSSLNLEQFHEMFDPLATRPMRLSSITSLGDSLDADLALALARGEAFIEQPIILKAAQGKQSTDFLWCSLTTIKCISERVVHLLQTHKLTGWKTYPVSVFDQQNNLIKGYWGLSITGRGGQRDYSKSALVQKPPIVNGGKPYQVYQGLFFDIASWDGSDFFYGAGALLTTDKVYRLFRRAKVTNVRFTPMTEVETPAYIVEQLRRSR